MVHRRTASASHILAGLEPVYSGGIVIARSLRFCLGTNRPERLALCLPGGRQ